MQIDFRARRQINPTEERTTAKSCHWDRLTASAAYEQGHEQIAQVGQYLEEHIRDKPLQSVLMAAGLGMILAFLWKR